MLNHITVMGRMTKDPELRYTGKGTPVCSFSLAVDRDMPGPDGARETDFFNCVAWSKGGEFVKNYFHKGSMAIVAGSLQTRRYEDKNGVERTVYEIVANRTYFGEAKKSSGDAPEQERRGVTFTEIEADGDLPF